MRLALCVLTVCLGVAAARTPAESKEYVEYDYDVAPGSDPSGHGQYISDANGAGGGDSSGGGGGSHGKTGYSAGSGLRSIAQGSADQADSAVANQQAAAKQASYVAQNTLAQAAVQASATAQAALAGKQVLLQGLEQQHVDAHTGLDGEILQLQQAKRSAKAAQQASHQALNQVNVLTAALNAAQATADQAGQSASEAMAELASQSAMVGTAKQRLETVDEQLHAARIDFEATQVAAQKAAASAQAAQNNAAKAAAHASAGGGPVDGDYGGLSSHRGDHVVQAANHNYKYKLAPRNLAGY